MLADELTSITGRLVVDDDNWCVTGLNWDQAGAGKEKLNAVADSGKYRFT